MVLPGTELWRVLLAETRLGDCNETGNSEATRCVCVCSFACEAEGARVNVGEGWCSRAMAHALLQVLDG